MTEKETKTESSSQDTLLEKHAQAIETAIDKGNATAAALLISVYGGQKRRFLPSILDRNLAALDEACFADPKGVLRWLLPSAALQWFIAQPSKERAARLQALQNGKYVEDFANCFASTSWGGHSGYNVLDDCESLLTWKIVTPDDFRRFATNVAVYATEQTPDKMARVVIDKNWTTVADIYDVAIKRTFRGYDTAYWITLWSALLPVCVRVGDQNLTRKVSDELKHKSDYQAKHSSS